MELVSPFTPAPNVKIMVNVGALLDIPTGTYLRGRYGENILNGGLSPLTGIVGAGNMFKSTEMHYQSFTALSRMAKSIGSTFDTEVNIQEWHLAEMISRIHELEGEDILETGRWVITDKTVYSGNKWNEAYKDFLEDKIKNFSKYQVATPFWNRNRTGPLMMAIPSFNELDSFTEFETDDVTKMQNENELGESGGNTIHMRQGLAKMRFLMEAPRLNCAAYNYLLMTAHIGKESTMQSAGGGREVPITVLKHLKNGDAIKGTTKKFTFVTHNCWHCYNATPLMQAEGNGPLYPRDSNDNVKYDTDLNTVHLRNLRSKSGVSGMSIVHIVSQTEGVLPSLTEFHYIKEMDRYGLEGNMQNYALSLYPDVKLSRTTVRGKIDSDPKLRRALNITAELCQIDQLWQGIFDDDIVIPTPKELYENIKALGYDWDLLLNTRGWWTYDNEKHHIPFLSTKDLVEMQTIVNGKPLYHPYWLEDDKKTIKKVIK